MAGLQTAENHRASFPPSEYSLPPECIQPDGALNLLAQSHGGWFRPLPPLLYTSCLSLRSTWPFPPGTFRFTPEYEEAAPAPSQFHLHPPDRWQVPPRPPLFRRISHFLILTGEEVHPSRSISLSLSYGLYQEFL